MASSERLDTFFAAWLAAAQRGEGAWFEEHLAEDFAYVNQIGGISGKSELVAANNRHQNCYDLREIAARWYGDLGIGVGRYRAQGNIPQSVPVTEALREKYAAGCDIRFTVVCRRTDAGPRCLTLQTTVVDQPDTGSTDTILEEETSWTSG